MVVVDPEQVERLFERVFGRLVARQIFNGRGALLLVAVLVLVVLVEEDFAAVNERNDRAVERAVLLLLLAVVGQIVRVVVQLEVLDVHGHVCAVCGQRVTRVSNIIPVEVSINAVQIVHLKYLIEIK